MSTVKISDGIDDRRIAEEEGRKCTLSHLMDDNAAKVPISVDHSTHNMTIFLFPEIMEIREQRRKVVTIGPYHRNDSMLFDNAFKRSIVNIMTCAFELDAGKFLNKMVMKEARVRSCYEEDSDNTYPMKTKEFVQMLLLDGCFILLALKISQKNRLSGDMADFLAKMLQTKGTLVTHRLMDDLRNFVLHLEMHQESLIGDLLQMENQIPLFVLQELCDVCPELGDFVGSSIVDLALYCFKHVCPKMNKVKSEMPKDLCHLLDVFHWSRVPKDKYKIDERFKSQTLSELRTLHAVDFHKSGMKFRKSSGSSLDVEIKNPFYRKTCVVQLPTVDVKNYQFWVLESLVTFEARYKQRGFYFATFVQCMGSILETEKDVKLLQKSGILPKDNEVSDNYVISFFQQLSHCIKPFRSVPHSLDGYKNGVYFVQETSERSEETVVRCWFRF